MILGLYRHLIEQAMFCVFFGAHFAEPNFLGGVAISPAVSSDFSVCNAQIRVLGFVGNHRSGRLQYFF